MNNHEPRLTMDLLFKKFFALYNNSKFLESLFSTIVI